MAKQGTALEFDGEADNGDRLLNHNAAVRDNLQMILALKEAIAEGDLAEAAMYWYATPESVRESLWMAPTRGGIFSTYERQVIKTSEFRLSYHTNEQENGNE